MRVTGELGDANLAAIRRGTDAVVRVQAERGRHALVADGLFVREGLFHVTPEVSLKPWRNCSREMRIVALINDRDVIDLPAMLRLFAQANILLQAGRILRHLGLWEQGVRVAPAMAPPEIVERLIETWLDDPFPDYATEPVMVYANG